MPTGRKTIGTKTAVAALGLVAAVSLAGCSNSSSTGEDSSASASTYSTVEDCTGAGQVWLVVSTDEGEVLANECVGTPENGTAALEAAGLSIGRDSSGQFICQIGDYPAECPTTYDKYWNYYHAEPAGTWYYSQEGSDAYVPEAGWIEGWCYGSTCTPEGIEGDAAPQIDTSAPATGDGEETSADGSDSSAAPSAGESTAA